MQVKKTLTTVFMGLQALVPAAQTVPATWQQIIIEEKGTAWPQVYIIQHDSSVYTMAQPGRMLHKAGTAELDAFMQSLVFDERVEKDPLLFFGKDSLWLAGEAKNLWFGWLEKKNEPTLIDSMAIQLLRQYDEKVKTVLWALKGMGRPGEGISYRVYMVTPADTLQARVYNTSPARLVASDSSRLFYSDLLSEDGQPPTAKKISESLFRQMLVGRLYHSFLADTSENILIRQQYGRSLKKLEKNFSIIDAKLLYMASLDWDGKGRCLEMKLASPGLAGNVCFYTVFGQTGIKRSFNAFLRKNADLARQVQQNPVYRYTRSAPQCRGEIHFVNNRSFSSYAMRAFMEDVEKAGESKKAWRKKLKGAILYTLTQVERQNGEGYMSTISWCSRWLFLKDGSIVYWEPMKGRYQHFAQWTDETKLPEI